MRDARRSAYSLLAGAALILTAAGCGTGRHVSANVAAAQKRPASSAASWNWVAGPYLNDSDQDPIGDEDGDNKHDVDNDPSSDYKFEAENKVYLDEDDGVITLGGPHAGPADRREVTAFVARYFAAARAADGAKVCAMYVPGSARKIPAYANSWLAPHYLRGSKTCAATLDRLLEHYRHELRAPVVVTDVRHKEHQAMAVFGSTTMRPGYLNVIRQHGKWWLEVPLLGLSLVANSMD